MVKRYDVQNVHSPGGRYSHIGEIGSNARLFHLAGQTGTAPDGTIGEGIEEQVTLVYQNIKTILKECGMNFENLAKIAVFLTSPDYIEAHRTIQKQILDGVVPASTLLIVSRLARQEYLVEVEAIAAID
ncbi:MAG: RidA family protein [Nitrospinota bacterium]|nr:RidA family protein [Nitrospinota bacterium]